MINLWLYNLDGLLQFIMEYNLTDTRNIKKYIIWDNQWKINERPHIKVITC